MSVQFRFPSSETTPKLIEKSEGKIGTGSGSDRPKTPCVTSTSSTGLSPYCSTLSYWPVATAPGSEFASDRQLSIRGQPVGLKLSKRPRSAISNRPLAMWQSAMSSGQSYSRLSLFNQQGKRFQMQTRLIQTTTGANHVILLTTMRTDQIRHFKMCALQRL